MGNLKTHEIEMKTREGREPQKKVIVALKASPREHKKKDIPKSTISEDDEQEDELILLVKNMRRRQPKRKMARKGKKAMKATT